MAIIFNNIDTTQQIPRKRVVKQWIKEVIKGCKKECGDITVALCSDSYITNANQQFLNHNYPTDIITFNYNEQKTINGDLLISIDTVKSNSSIYQCSYQEELNRVIIHGILHLLGFDDHKAEDIKKMREKEKECLILLEKYK